MKITVVGGGNTGQALAGYVASMEHAVMLFTRDSEKARMISERGIQMTGAMKGHVSVNSTSDPRKAVEFGEVILVATTAQGHGPVCRMMEPYLKCRQSIIIFNGNWGALEFKRIIGDKMERKGLTLAETGAMLVICRVLKPGEVHIKKIKQSVSLAALGSETGEGLANRMKEIFPQFQAVGDVYETSLNNSNTMLHTPIALFNAARMDGGEPFRFYRDGASPKAVAFVERMDQERLEVGKALGVRTMGALQILNSFWPRKHDVLYDAIHLNDSYKVAEGPRSLHHRYLYEDVPFGLVPLSELGRRLGVPTPYMDSIIETAGLLLEEDFRSMGPSLDYGAIVADLTGR